MILDDPRDPSEMGGDADGADEMNPVEPEVAPEEDQTPKWDDPSRVGSG